MLLAGILTMGPIRLPLRRAPLHYSFLHGKKVGIIRLLCIYADLSKDLSIVCCSVVLYLLYLNFSSCCLYRIYRKSLEQELDRILWKLANEEASQLPPPTTGNYLFLDYLFSTKYKFTNNVP